MIGDLPDADAKPPEESLFVCKLNPVTSDEDLEIIFSRFGKVTSCDVIRDYKTGDSLCFAFVTFETKEQAEAAYFKMDNVLIDDRRIHVDFSQSMHGLWRNYKRFGKKGGTAEDGNEAGERGARREGRVNREFVAGDGRRTYEIKGSAMGHIGGGTATYRGEGRGENRARRRVTIGEKTTEDGTRGYAANEVEAGTAIDAEMRTAIGAGEGTGAGTGAETETGTQTGTGTGIERRTANASVVAVGIETGRRIAGAIGVGAEAATLLGGTAETNVGERMRRRVGAGRAAQTRRIGGSQPPRDAPGKDEYDY